MKQFITTFCCVLVLLATAFHASAYDEFIQFEVDGTRYHVLSQEEKTVEITSGNRWDETVVIPREVSYSDNAYTVVKIADNAFNGARMTSITLPNTLISIGSGAFSSSNLTSLTIPASVVEMKEKVFISCLRLESILVEPDNEYFSSLDGILFNKDYTTLIQCPPRKTEAMIPNSVTTIGDDAFRSCALRSVLIPAFVTSIGSGAFSSENLQEILVDDGNEYYSSGNGSLLSKDGTKLIQAPGGVKNVVIPNSVTFIDEWAFWGFALEFVDIPNSVVTIGKSAFANCYRLLSVDIPNSVTTIGEGAFERCERLGLVTIPNSVTSIGVVAFAACNALTSVVIPNSITTISNNLFTNCASLTTVTIPSSVTSIGDWAFWNCPALKIIENQSRIPVECDPGFSDDNYANATLYVPRGTTDVYRQTSPWQNFLNIEEKDFSGIGEIDAEGECTIDISVEDGVIIVSGLDRAQPVTICDIQGRIMYTGCEHRIEGLASGVYVVNAGNNIVKCAIK